MGRELNDRKGLQPISRNISGTCLGWTDVGSGRSSWLFRF